MSIAHIWEQCWLNPTDSSPWSHPMSARTLYCGTKLAIVFRRPTSRCDIMLIIRRGSSNGGQMLQLNDCGISGFRFYPCSTLTTLCALSFMWLCSNPWCLFLDTWFSASDSGRAAAHWLVDGLSRMMIGRLIWDPVNRMPLSCAAQVTMLQLLAWSAQVRG